MAATRSSDEAALRPARPAADRAIERRVDAPARADDARREAAADPAALGRAGHRRGRAQGRRLGLQPHRPGADQRAPADRRGGVAARHPDPVRLRHDPRLPHDLPDPARSGEQLRSRRRDGPTIASARASRAAVGLKQIYSPMVDVSHDPRWGRIAEAGGEDPYLNSVLRGRARQGRAGQRLQRAGQGRDERQALRGLRPAGGRARLRHDRHVRAAAAQPVPAAVQGGDRRRRGHRDVLLQRDQRRAGLRELRSSRRNCSSASGASTASSRATTRRWPSCALPARRPADGSLRPRRRRRRPRRRGARAQRRHRLGDGEHDHPRLRPAAARPRGGSRCAGSTTPCGGSCASSSAPGCSTDPYVDPAAAEAAQLRPDAVAAARKAAGRSMVLLKNEGGILPLDPGKKTAVIGPLGDNEHDMLGPWWGRGRDEDAVTVLDGISAQSPGATFAQGCTIADREPPEQPAGGRVRPRPRRRGRGRGGRVRPTRSCSRWARRADTAARRRRDATSS